MTTALSSSIESVLAQMRALQQSSPALAIRSAEVPGAAKTGFAAELQQSLQRVSALQNGAASQARAFQLGEPGVALSDVMINMQKADLAFQASVQVRNRLVAAYQEIANMPV